MTPTQGLKLLSTLDADGRLTVELAEETLPPPRADEVLVRVEAAPINPSDLALLFASADLENADYSEGRIVAPMPDAARRALAGRVGQPMAIGNEGAGTVIDAALARALLRGSCLDVLVDRGIRLARLPDDAALALRRARSRAIRDRPVAAAPAEHVQEQR